MQTQHSAIIITTYIMRRLLKVSFLKNKVRKKIVQPPFTSLKCWKKFLIQKLAYTASMYTCHMLMRIYIPFTVYIKQLISQLISTIWLIHINMPRVRRTTVIFGYTQFLCMTSHLTLRDRYPAKSLRSSRLLISGNSKISSSSPMIASQAWLWLCHILVFS